MKILASIKVVIAAGERRVQGMFVRLSFVMARKSPLDLVFGPSNREGEIEVSRDQVLAEARRSMELFPMDYADIEGYWTGKIQVTPLNRSAVERALSAYRLFRTYKHPPGYEENLRVADAALAQLLDAALTAVVEWETPEPIEVESVRVVAGE